ncbi:hypothetical protein INP77_05350 [Methylophilus sp. 13]|uniref:HEPN domain-containing protein n=1 Tax=Methylophilus sp. 13 TaxID=2781018 RepID=UPI00188E242A|nr:HEPN domain-containing protein [Methylophilus sp. 13]MBF5038915.1 hypothetical protein [Methylophilus sp. 13]
MPSKWITVAPFSNPNIAPKIELPFNLGHGVSIAEIPPAIFALQQNDSVSKAFKESLESKRYCLLIEYEAESLGQEQINASEKLCFAHKTLWLLKNASFGVEGYGHINLIENEYIVRQAVKTSICYLSGNDVYEPLDNGDFDDYIKIFNTLISLKRGTPLTVTLKSIIKGVTEFQWEWRYLCFWVALEALFGAETEIRYRLSQRMGLFLGTDLKEASEIYEFIKRAYVYRSKVVHGSELKKFNGDESLDLMAELERQLRKAVIKILSSQNLITIFEGKSRESYLDTLAFKSN